MCESCIASLGPLKTGKQCQKPITLSYWHGGWRCGVSRQAIESKLVAVATIYRRRLAAGLFSPGGDGFE